MGVRLSDKSIRLAREALGSSPALWKGRFDKKALFLGTHARGDQVRCRP